LTFPVEELAMPTDVDPQLAPIRDSCMLCLRRRNKVAGVLVLSSEQENFFRSFEGLLLSYASLLSLAFPEHDFFPLEALCLEFMPSLQRQFEMERVFPFLERVKRAQGRIMQQMLAGTISQPHPLSLDELERYALLELEQELLLEAKSTMEI
jgi:hypothetical protein